MPYAQPAHDKQLAWVLPVDRTGLSIAAGYLGLFSILVVFAPISLVVGILAILDLRRKPGKLGMGRAIFGTVMGALFTAAILAVVAKHA